MGATSLHSAENWQEAVWAAKRYVGEYSAQTVKVEEERDGAWQVVADAHGPVKV